MNLLNYIILFVLAIILFNIAWPLLIGLFLYVIISQIIAKIRFKKAMYDQKQQEAFYETIEKPQSGLDIIDVEYEEKR